MGNQRDMKRFFCPLLIQKGAWAVVPKSTKVHFLRNIPWDWTESPTFSNIFWVWLQTSLPAEPILLIVLIIRRKICQLPTANCTSFLHHGRLLVSWTRGAASRVLRTHKLRSPLWFCCSNKRPAASCVRIILFWSTNRCVVSLESIVFESRRGRLFGPMHECFENGYGQTRG